MGDDGNDGDDDNKMAIVIMRTMAIAITRVMMLLVTARIRIVATIRVMKDVNTDNENDNHSDG